MVIPDEWMPDARMDRIICHWTAGTYTPNAVDRSHYHLLIDGAPALHRGMFSIKKNEAPIVGVMYAAHTARTNTGSIGVSVCCMGGAVEAPWSPGKWPMKREQWDMLVKVLAILCARYRIPVSMRTVLTHAEVSTTLLRPQKGKWDYTRLPFEPKLIGHKAIGDRLRSEVTAAIR